MKSLNQIAIDIEDNEEVEKLFQGLKPGDPVRIIVEATVMEITDRRVQCSVDGVEDVSDIEGDEVEEEEEDDDDILDRTRDDHPESYLGDD